MYPPTYWKRQEGQWFGPKYLLRQFLGSGAFGAVFRADEILAERVMQSAAIKIVIADQEGLDKQLDELQLAVKLRHPHLINGITCEQGEISGDLCLGLVMELAEESLESYCQRYPQGLSVESVCAITEHLAKGLAALHRDNIIHRDLKPANVLLVQDLWKLGDFGIARSLRDQTSAYTRASQQIGTAAYMPPEAYSGKIAPAWDLWALGVLAHQLVSAQHPFPTELAPELMRMVLMEEPQIAPAVTSPLREIVTGCLIKDPQRRWTAEQVLDALRPQPPVIQYAAPGVASLQIITENLGGGVILELVQLPAGQFMMGSPDSNPEALDREKPQHLVQVKAFAIGKYPITQAQYEAVMGENLSYFAGHPNNPVECVTWNAAKEFCKKLSQATGKNYRLPSEAEWEYACRAGTNTQYSFGDNADELKDYAWFGNNSGKKRIDASALWQEDSDNDRYRQKIEENECQTHPVGEKNPNGWGLYDMYGNVWEWCEDSWHKDYQGAPTDGSPWIDNHSQTRVIRGGSWGDNPRNCRSAYRSRDNPADQYGSNGFRVVCVRPRFSSSSPGSAEQVLDALRPQPPVIQYATPKVGSLQIITENLGSGVALELVQLPAGQFMMGASDNDLGANENEKPQHLVQIRSFAIGKYPATQEQYKSIMGRNPSFLRGKLKNPVEQVSWDNAQVFCKKLSQLTGKHYRLPSEAEWEYACRAGTTTRYSFGDNADQLEDYAWFWNNSRRKTHPVGEKKPNLWGLYDMHGNVWEWCEDNWHKNYQGAPKDEIAWIEKDDDSRVLRGGCWYFNSWFCRSSYRDRLGSNNGYVNRGFRLVLSL